MNVDETFDPATANAISQNALSAFLLLRKRLLHIDTIQSAHGLPFSHVQALHVLKEKGEITVSEISAHLGIGKSNITPMVDRLIADQYVIRSKDKADKRVVKIILLDKGREKIQAILQTIEAQIQKFSEDISFDDFQEMSDSLQSIARILSPPA